jgi:chromosome segregation ATPase
MSAKVRDTYDHMHGYYGQP